VSVSGLGAEHRIKARDLAVEAAVLALHHAGAVHYTMGPRRWEGIARDLKAFQGEYPHFADCSAFFTWCLWNGLDHFDVRDCVNGERWRGGYTGTLLTHGERVRGGIVRADAAIYGTRFPGEHVALCIGGGLVISHGSEAGPFKLPIHYRGDLLAVRRYI
jgi:hypothetical protein